MANLCIELNIFLFHFIDLAEVASKEINQKWFDLAEVDEDSD